MMPLTTATRSTHGFSPASIRTFRFTGASLEPDGLVRLGYALDAAVVFEERYRLPVPAPLTSQEITRAEPLLRLLHLVAGTSYYKTAAPPGVDVEGPLPGPAQRTMLNALYSEGLGEFAYQNQLPGVPRPQFPEEPAPRYVDDLGSSVGLLVPVGGGKDSVVAFETARRTEPDVTLFSVGNAAPIARTADATGVRRLVAERELDPELATLGRMGALNGHVPVTAIISCVALLTAFLNGFRTVAMANERSASHGNLHWRGTEINHQFSKGLRFERLFRAALSEAAPHLEYFSLLRPASELGIARAFARLPQYHRGFTSCNRVFRIDPQLRARTWCAECPKCRFVFLALAPFMQPQRLKEIFNHSMLDEPEQYPGFAALAAVGSHKPFECVGEEAESVAAFRLLAQDASWRDQAVVARFSDEVLPTITNDYGVPRDILTLSDDHEVPGRLMTAVHEILGA